MSVPFPLGLFRVLLGACALMVSVVSAVDYLVIDLTAGANASSYPVSHLDAPPAGGWTDEFKTTKLVLRRITAGSFFMGSPTSEQGRYDNEERHQVTLTKDFLMGVFEVTQRQWQLVMGNRPSFFNNDTYYAKRPVEKVSYVAIREGGSDVTIGTAWVGSYQPNAWGLCDMHGNVWEICVDRYAADYGPGRSLDPLGATTGTFYNWKGGGIVSNARNCRAARRRDDRSMTASSND